MARPAAEQRGGRAEDAAARPAAACAPRAGPGAARLPEGAGEPSGRAPAHGRSVSAGRATAPALAPARRPPAETAGDGPDDRLVHKVAAALAEALALAPEVQAALRADTPLFGHLPELDSLALATVLAALEDRLGMRVEAEDVTADIFETLGTLAAFVREARGR